MTTHDLQRTQDHLELLTLEARYASTWDCGDAAGWAGVFTADGTFEITAVGERPPVVVRGRQALAAFCADFTSSTQGVHLPSLPLLEISSETASGTVPFHFVGISRLRPDHTVSRSASGTYRVEYRRTADGWRIHRRVETALISSRAEHFGS
ncbi:nuclear transport factor 2 family protein [Microbacterium sp. CFH 31415]|uniref:nuclear transport factor 2 family protein n=1 Tax=Microbacterium sp. CFH 31415 TaxID=2921732 RepID=UPI001F14818A|nr:nuclear transport factor 2 family protein [Microbacterium sp. CFH 31415]MCH6231639.1 nuclear transport factor 2 family protein [Microbacterium sp. CFH 31415]